KFASFFLVLDGISINDTGGSTLLDAKLTTLNGVAVTLDGTDAHVADSWTKFTNGSLTVNGDASGLGYSLTGLTDVDGSSLYAESGGQLALPDLTSYVSYGYFEAKGTNSTTTAPSTLDVSALTTVTQTGGWGVNAYNGGTLKLSGLSSLTSTKGIAINDTGGSTLLDAKLTTLNGVSVNTDGSDPGLVSAWTTFTGGSLTITSGTLTFPKLTDAQITVGSGAMLVLPVLTTGDVTITDGASVTIQGTAVSLPADGTSGATINVPQTTGLTITLKNTGTLTGTTFNVGQGSNVVLYGGTYLGGTTFQVGNGAMVDLTGGTSTTYGGTLAGSGAGTVELTDDSARLYAAVGGLTLNFAGGTSITANAAKITLDGSGAAMTALALASNSGTLALTNGAGLSTSGDFSNSGTLTVGDTLNVGGKFTQTSAGTLDDQIGGGPTSGNFGQVAATGTATLAGNFNVAPPRSPLPRWPPPSMPPCPHRAPCHCRSLGPSTRRFPEETPQASSGWAGPPPGKVRSPSIAPATSESAPPAARLFFSRCRTETISTSPANTAR
ncbi:MAG TPA: hypothetical protein PK867_26410, partial [Pirellulales bacterium]|nr:hypothetical protein [Pirellulales bacterium]